MMACCLRSTVSATGPVALVVRPGPSASAPAQTLILHSSYSLKGFSFLDATGAGCGFLSLGQQLPLQRQPPAGALSLAQPGQPEPYTIQHNACVATYEPYTRSVYFSEGFALMRLDATGAVTPLAGRQEERGVAHGPAEAARFDNITALAADGEGGLLVADGPRIYHIRVAPPPRPPPGAPPPQPAPTALLRDSAAGRASSSATGEDGTDGDGADDGHDGTASTADLEPVPSVDYGRWWELALQGSEGGGEGGSGKDWVEVPYHEYFEPYGIVRRDQEERGVAHGPAEAARFDNITALAADGEGGLLVADGPRIYHIRVAPPPRPPPGAPPPQPAPTALLRDSAAGRASSSATGEDGTDGDGADDGHDGTASTADLEVRLTALVNARGAGSAAFAVSVEAFYTRPDGAAWTALAVDAASGSLLATTATALHRLRLPATAAASPPPVPLADASDSGSAAPGPSCAGDGGAQHALTPLLVSGVHGSAGKADGGWQYARFSSMNGVAVDARGGTAWLTDGSRLRSVDLCSGAATTWLADLPNDVRAPSVLPNGELVICCPSDNCIKVVGIGFAPHPLWRPAAPSGQCPRIATADTASAAAPDADGSRAVTLAPLPSASPYLPYSLLPLLLCGADPVVYGAADPTTDVGITATNGGDRGRFHAHAVVLAAASEYFRALLVGGRFAEAAPAASAPAAKAAAAKAAAANPSGGGGSSRRQVELPEADPAAFAAVLRYCYRSLALGARSGGGGGAGAAAAIDPLPCTPPALLCSVAELADRLLVPGLVAEAQRRLLAGVWPEGVVELMLWAEVRGPAFMLLLDGLRGFMLRYVREVVEAAPDSVGALAAGSPRELMQEVFVKHGVDPDCTKYGNCNAETGECMCHFGFTGPSCQEPVLPACHSTKPVNGLNTSVPLYGGDYPKNCHCLKQLQRIACTDPRHWYDYYKCNQAVFWNWKAVRCYEYKDKPAEEQLSDPPEPAQGGVVWKRGVWLAVEPGGDPFGLEPADSPPELAQKGVVWLPLSKCPDRCSGRGHCFARSPGAEPQCECAAWYFGPGCASSAAQFCPLGCSGRGVCHGGFCHCAPGWWSYGCSRSKAYMADEYTPHTTDLKIYVYDVPESLAYMRSHTDGWPLHSAIYAADDVFFFRLLADWRVRTENPWEANLFYVPTYVYWYIGNVGFPGDHFSRVIRWVRQSFPFWNVTGGRNHVLSSTNDRGCCDLYRLGSELQRPIKLVHFAQSGRGLARGAWALVNESTLIDGKPMPGHFKARLEDPAFRSAVIEYLHLQPEQPPPDAEPGQGAGHRSRFRGFPPFQLEALQAEREPCFRPEHDVAFPNTLSLAEPDSWSGVLERAYLYDSNSTAALQNSYILHALNAVHGPGGNGSGAAVALPAARFNFERKRDLLFSFDGFSKPDMSYSGGVRQGLIALFGNTTRPDVAINRPGLSGRKMMLRSRFCFVPMGYGWGVRLTQAVYAGCVPVLTQDHIWPTLWDVLPYERFSIRLSRHNLHRLLEVLEAVGPERLRGLQEGLAEVHRAFIWPASSGGLAYNCTLLSLHRRLLNMWTAMF
ncbi:hypothetical protein GPECTOR_5g263 [Gonium pectorale]|uniref:EGF-like domain-containing protein n=1 Tax=Gonium pectorale TaxID=33097 RepID=A0A150GW91_GONPE|nr:hypothetical protein GPECTOR_5g263 [Gonium pectorale]|eukprot:KXZ54166.1 hypothetical protein GPECTOR_5g263 [Gonium pectorale]